MVLAPKKPAQQAQASPSPEHKTCLIQNPAISREKSRTSRQDSRTFFYILKGIFSRFQEDVSRIQGYFFQI